MRHELPSPSSSAGPVRDRFATTQWSLVLAAGNLEQVDAQTAMAQLCQAYWQPLYAFVRRRGYAPADAQDLTQAFFAQLLEKQTLQVADPARGRFRSFLLTSLDHFILHQRQRAKAQKRGGGRLALSLDWSQSESRLSLEPIDRMSPERLFERHWALTLLELVLVRLEEECRTAGKSTQWELLRPALSGDRERLPYAEIAAALGTTADQARQAAHRLKQRYRALLREEVARTVAQPSEVDDELSSLLAALST